MDNPELHQFYINKAAEVAKSSTCERRKCGAIIVNNEIIIGEGFNSPAGNLEINRRCNEMKSSLNSKLTDKTCCVHAEQRAIRNALRTNPELIKDSTIYFSSVDKEGNKISSGDPYCTHCSKMAIDEGISAWVLEHENGIKIYDAEEYHLTSLNFQT